MTSQNKTKVGLKVNSKHVTPGEIASQNKTKVGLKGDVVGFNSYLLI